MSQSQNNKVSFSAPSNIAFVKYWGKYGRQLPINPSISMTLSECKTICHVEYDLDTEDSGIKSFIFEGKENDKFKQRLQKFLTSIEDVFPLSKRLSLKIKSNNTFPHSAGIASSASAMSAFCACLVEIEKEVLKENFKFNFNERVSFLSRLASGSACRSVYAHYAIWGELENFSNDYAIEFKDFHEKFASLCDSVVIVSSEEKSVSSSHGHSLMDNHVYKASRKQQANENMKSIIRSMKEGNLEKFGETLELEALSLHAMMMTSSPSYILLAPNSIAVINEVREFRKERSIPLYFTIDAGPNIHLIYPQEYKKEILDFIQNKLAIYSEQTIHDRIGLGVEKININE